MARKPRVEFDGAFYHVIVRGNQRQKVFGGDRDRLAYLERLESGWGSGLLILILSFAIHLLHHGTAP